MKLARDVYQRKLRRKDKRQQIRDLKKNLLIIKLWDEVRLLQEKKEAEIYKMLEDVGVLKREKQFLESICTFEV